MKDQAGKYLQNLISDFMIEVGKKAGSMVILRFMAQKTKIDDVAIY